MAVTQIWSTAPVDYTKPCTSGLRKKIKSKARLKKRKKVSHYTSEERNRVNYTTGSEHLLHIVLRQRATRNSVLLNAVGTAHPPRESGTEQ